MPRPYLLAVHSNPTLLSPTLWKEWCLREHIRDMVYHNVAKTAGYYQSSSETFTSIPEDSNATPPQDNSDSMPYLALYQSDRANLDTSHTEESRKIRLTGETWKAEGCDGKNVFEVADLVFRDGVLVEVLGSYECNENVAPHIIHVTLTGEEVEGKVQFEHVNAVSILDGYRRTLLYRFPGVKENVGCVCLVHEFERLDSSHLPAVKAEMETIEPTKDCAFVLRSYELLGSEGFGGHCNKPEGLD